MLLTSLTMLLILWLLIVAGGVVLIRIIQGDPSV
jgi:hypothetical protein